MAKKKAPKVLEPEQWAQIFELQSVRDRALLLLAYKTSLRIGEAVRLRAKGEVRVRRDAGYLEVPCEKGCKTGYRKVPIPNHKSLNAALDAWELERPDSEFYFCAADGKPVQPNVIRRNLARASYRLWGGGVTTDKRGKVTAYHPNVKVTPHMTRHSWTTERIAEGRNLLGIQQMGGWKNLKTMTGTYSHAMMQHAQEMVDNWDE